MKPELKHPDLMSNAEIAQLLPMLDELIKWAKQVQDYALNEALNGTEFKGFKVVAGRSNRKFDDEDKVASTLLAEGYNEAMIYERRLLALTKLEAMLGKAQFKTVLGGLVSKPQGRPTLVPDTDNRPSYVPEATAADDFKD